MKVRFQAVKQDRRVERPEARVEGGDWAILGDIPGSDFSIVAWYLKLAALSGEQRDPCSAMFIDEQKRPLVYYRTYSTHRILSCLYPILVLSQCWKRF